MKVFCENDSDFVLNIQIIKGLICFFLTEKWKNPNFEPVIRLKDTGRITGFELFYRFSFFPSKNNRV